MNKSCSKRDIRRPDNDGLTVDFSTFGVLEIIFVLGLRNALQHFNYNFRKLSSVLGPLRFQASDSKWYDAKKMRHGSWKFRISSTTAITEWEKCRGILSMDSRKLDFSSQFFGRFNLIWFIRSWIISHFDWYLPVCKIFLTTNSKGRILPSLLLSDLVISHLGNRVPHYRIIFVCCTATSKKYYRIHKLLQCRSWQESVFGCHRKEFLYQPINSSAVAEALQLEKISYKCDGLMARNFFEERPWGTFHTW